MAAETLTKAYMVTPWYSEIVFAETPGKAKSSAPFSREYSFTEISVRRAPLFDGLKHPIALTDYLERGFWLECEGCYAHVQGDDPDAPPVITDDERIFCSEECRQRETERAIERPSKSGAAVNG